MLCTYFNLGKRAISFRLVVHSDHLYKKLAKWVTTCQKLVRPESLWFVSYLFLKLRKSPFHKKSVFENIDAFNLYFTFYKVDITLVTTMSGCDVMTNTIDCFWKVCSKPPSYLIMVINLSVPWWIYLEQNKTVTTMMSMLMENV